MRQHNMGIYKSFFRSRVKEPDLKARNLSPKQILSLRYQCALENKDFKTAESLKAIIDSHDEQKIGASQKNDVSEARQKAEQLFRR